ncbi:MAG: NAD(P)-binding protein [Armatimonadetes bacterium]|nr:NAD(P)-binding protein [Armatimonadota bacterium]
MECGSDCPLSRRRFLGNCLAASAALLLDLSLPLFTARPAVAAVLEEELGRFSGDLYFEQMHTELWGQEVAAGKSAGTVDPGIVDILIVGGGIAGLDAAYLLLQHPRVKESGAVVRLLETNDEPGGNAKEFAWRGIPYTNSAAYFYLFEPEHPIQKLYQSLGILDEAIVPGKADRESVLIGDRVWSAVFDLGRGDPREADELRRASAFFSSLNGEDLYPEVPFQAEGPYSREEFVRLDRTSLGQLLDRGGTLKAGVQVPSIPGLMREFIENYCYSSFGCAADRVSAWQGLNWFAAEFAEDGVAVLPGGNGRITTRLREKIRALDPDCLKMSLPVVDVAHDARTGVNTVVAAASRNPAVGSYLTYRARQVLLACPLFVAGRLLQSELASDVRSRLKGLNYSAYVVCNALVESPVYADCWDTYCLDDCRLFGDSGEAFYRQKPFTDLVNAGWVVRKSLERSGRSPDLDRTVLTAYSPHPFQGQREELLRDDYCESLRGKVRRELVRRLGPQGLKETDVADVRLARWGHAMLCANPGLISSGILEELQRSVAALGIFFAGAELLGAPTIENSHLTAMTAVEGLVEGLEGPPG